MRATTWMLRGALLSALCIAPAFSQRVSFGVVAGVPLGDAPTDELNRMHADTRRWTAGPSVQLRLLAGFSLGVDALYRFYGSSSSTDVDFGTGTVTTHADSARTTREWTMPVYLKHRIPKLGCNCFGSVGYVGGHFTTHTTTRFTYTNQSAAQTLRYNYSDWHHGMVFGVGTEFKVGPLKVSPELRYTRWIGWPSQTIGVIVPTTPSWSGDFSPIPNASAAASPVASHSVSGGSPNQFAIVIGLRH